MFVIAASLVLLSLVSGIIGTTWGLLEALRQKRQAERQAKIASHTTEFLTGMFTSIDPQQAKLRDITVREILDKAGGQIGTAFPNDPQAELPIRRSMIWVYDKLGRYEEALNQAQAAYRLGIAIHGNADSQETAESLAEMALYQRQLARLNDAIPNATAAVAMWQRLYPGVNTNVVKGLLVLGGCLYESGRSAEAASKFQEALVMLQQIYTGDHIALAVTRGNVAKCLAESGQAQAALPEFEAVLAMYQRLFKGDNPAVALGFANVASCLQKLGRYPEALTNHQQALAMERRIYKGDHPSVASDMGNLASCLQALGRLNEAVALNQGMLEMNRRIYKGDHPQIAKALHFLAYSDEAMSRWPEALQLHQEALAMWTRVYPSDHPETAWEMGDVGRCLQYLGRYSNALTNFEAALAMEQRLFKGDHPDLARAMGDVAFCLEFLERSVEALPQHEAALAMRRRIYRADHPDVVESLSHLGVCLQHLGRFEEAVSNHQAAVQMSERIYRGDNVAVALRRNDLAVCLQSMGLWTGFLTNEQTNLAMLQRIYTGDHSSVGTVLIAVGDGLNLLNHPEEARVKFQDGAAMLQRLTDSQPSNNIVVCALAKSHLRLGNLDSEKGNADQASRHYRTGLDAAESVLSVDADHTEARQLRLALRAKLALERYESVVSKIVPGGQAEQSGLQKGDVLVRYGDRQIITADDLLLMLARVEGTQVKAEFMRGGAPLELTFKPGPIGASFEDRVTNTKGL